MQLINLIASMYEYPKEILIFRSNNYIQLFTGYYRKEKFIFTFDKMPEAALSKTAIRRVDLRRYKKRSNPF